MNRLEQRLNRIEAANQPQGANIIVISENETAEEKAKEMGVTMDSNTVVVRIREF